MIKVWLTSLGFAGLVSASVLQGAIAAPIAPVASKIIASHERSIERVYYYYHGRRYAYHYNGRYYTRRVYRHGQWHYYLKQQAAAYHPIRLFLTDGLQLDDRPLDAKPD
jgi:hypothetical protein